MTLDRDQNLRELTLVSQSSKEKAMNMNKQLEGILQEEEKMQQTNA